ncbi:MAG: NAD-dependent epimerase/dehydratase family protein [Hyphomonadaceae bacterium]|nr:NAD-dependent epimerase/dehydratase family protein [Hyphomonadaceae bacterium]
MSFYKGKNVLVLGGTGFVGTHFVRAALEAGANVTTTIHKRAPIVDDPRLKTVQAELANREQARAAMKDQEIVFHCAGAVSAAGVTASNPMEPITDNIALTAMVLEAAWKTGVERIQVFGSSTAYPVTDHPVTEEEMWSAPPHPSYFGYGWMRRYIERMAEFVHERSKTKVVLVRPTATYGRHDDFHPVTSHVIPALIRKAVERMDPYEVWGTGDEIRDFLHVEDLTRGCLLATEKYAVCQPINIGYGKTSTVKEIVRAILKGADYSDAKVIFNADRPTTIPKRMVDISKARDILGFEPLYTLDEGLADTVRWYRSEEGI